MNSYARKAFLTYLDIALSNAERTKQGTPWPPSKSRPQSTRWPIPSAETFERHVVLCRS